MNNKSYYFIAVLLLTFLACSKEKKKGTDQALKQFTYHDVEPADFPKLNIEGVNFPEDSVILNQWIHDSDKSKIYLHGWGIWTGITSLTDQKIPGDSRNLRVFETWLTPEEMIDSINNQPIKRSNRANLNKPNQFTHFSSSQQTVNDSIFESVSYSPAASDFAIENKIFMATTLYDIATNKNKKEIPFFPKNAITIKPVFKLLPTSGGETLFNIAFWPGTTNKLEAYPEQDWDTFVTVDVTNQSGQKDSIYNVDDFIHFKINDEDAYFLNKEFTENSGNQFNAKPGDIAILVGMHVGTREITNWTWQTFWWTPDPANPPLPSSKAVADMRPNELQGAPSNYAMSVAYYMVDPNEPYEGQDITGEPNYAFNPYLEAGFGPGVFNDSISYIQTGEEQIKTYVGVRTNCMSCHRMATVDPNALGNKKNSQTPYVGNAYISRSDSLFDGQLLLDFAWSIQGNVDTTGLKKYIEEN
ncbi:hypothetical protein QWY93_16035 [Echinicola jeungdonensis]|uniref:Cytochrome c domain-containing protein n=1 Tax=Echinicola jeungdonensis TaxID=709343 RepID=A0ABV5J5S9_9BACT|nr:hypothetical protein [Echinicola jeungdonensis]MDN3670831.1 hypothetical protein [Echinicola jeungdonensis]